MLYCYLSIWCTKCSWNSTHLLYLWEDYWLVQHCLTCLQPYYICILDDHLDPVKPSQITLISYVLTLINFSAHSSIFYFCKQDHTQLNHRRKKVTTKAELNECIVDVKKCQKLIEIIKIQFFNLFMGTHFTFS